MSEDTLKEREAALNAWVAAKNGDRKPVFGDRMRNMWAAETNPTRDGIYVRTVRIQSLNWFQMTDGNGKFWEQGRRASVLIDRMSPEELASRHPWEEK